MQIQWAVHSYVARALPLAAQRIVNFFAEAAPKDAKSPVALLNSPGIKTFCDRVGPGPIRGMEVMDGILYVVSGDELWSVKPDCENTALGSIGAGTDSSTSLITGATGASREAEVCFVITGGTSGTISSVTIGGDEILPEEGITFLTDAETTADQFIADRPTPVYESKAEDDSGSTRVTSFETSVPTGTETGDALVAQVSCADGDPIAITTFEGPVGWTQIGEQEPMTSSTRPDGKAGTSTIWFRFVAEGDPTDYTWTSDNAIRFVTGISRISGAARVQGLGPGLFPAVISINRSDTDDTGSGVLTPQAFSITPPTKNNLLLVRMPGASGSPLGSVYVVDPTYPLQVREFINSVAAPAPSGFAMSLICFSEAWEGISATGIRQLGTDIAKMENTWHVAVAPWVTHPDYEIEVNTERVGSVLIKRKLGSGGASEDFNGLEVVITTTGDVTVECC